MKRSFKTLKLEWQSVSFLDRKDSPTKLTFSVHGNIVILYVDFCTSPNSQAQEFNRQGLKYNAFVCSLTRTDI